jgi:ankyrin repeat protein
VVDINGIDQDDSTCLILALKNKHVEIARYFLKNHYSTLDIMIKSKFGNSINLALKLQEFDIIDQILNHKQIKSQDSYILNYMVPIFEKNPTENAKYMVKLLLDNGMNPNYLRMKHLKKDPNRDQKLPDKILDICPISLACMKY